MANRKTHEEFITEVKELVGDEYLVLGEYTLSKTKLKMKHVVCSKEYDVRPNSFLSGVRCPECFGGTPKTTESFKKEVNNLVGKEYEVMSEYASSNANIKMRHLTCGNTYKVIPNAFLRGRRCLICTGWKKDTEVFKEEVKELVGDEYIVVGEYINNKSKISIKHSTCGVQYEVRPKCFLEGRRCPTCKESKGERAVSDFLEKYGIESVREFRYYACRDKNQLPFDFAVIQDNKVVILIEYDGELHYNAYSHFGGERKLLNTQRRDAIKTKYCVDNNIPLIRIPYWEYDNIESILSEKMLPLLFNEDKYSAN